MTVKGHLLPSLITTLLLLLSACGGSGSRDGADNGGSDNQEAPAGFTVRVEPGEGGLADPGQQTVNEGEQARITLVPMDGYRVQSASGCGGRLNGNEYTTGPVVSDCQVSAHFIPEGSVSGQLLPAPSSAVDLSLNDAQAPLEDNGQCAAAQAIGNRATVHGFASATATGGDPEREHFAEENNPRDFYRVALNPGQVVELEVIDSGDSSELELYLWDGDCSQELDSSASGSDMEQVVSLLGGERVLEVRASAGVSRYVLRVTTAWESEEYDASDLEALTKSMPDFVPGEVILTFAPNAGARPHRGLSQALERAQGLQLRFRHEQTDRATLARVDAPASPSRMPGPPAQVLEQLAQRGNGKAYEKINTLRAIDQLTQQPGVQFAEPNYLLSAMRVPDDSYYGDQWHYEHIRLPEAWDHTTGQASDGDVIVAVVDTGVYLEHQDLTDKLLPGWDFHDHDDDPSDYNSNGTSSWHGTHVAGTIAAATNNGKGVAGVSWAARIMPVRVLGEDSGSRYDVMQGVRYAAGLVNDSGTVPERPAHVINLSLGGAGYSHSEQELYKEIRDAGIFVVAAAGNENSDQAMYPAGYVGVLSVSAVSCANKRASYSNYGPTVEVAAPGGDRDRCGLLRNGGVLSVVGSGSDDSRSSNYGWRMGTSMASPHVAGVLALMRAAYPELTPEQMGKLLVDGRLTDDLGETGRDEEYGYGLINAAKAVDAAISLSEGEPAWSARVVADPASLYLGQKSTASVMLRQEGDGEAPAVLDFRGEADWLEIYPDSVNERGLGGYQVEVDRTRFTEDDIGDHQSAVVFSLEDGSELRVQVHIQVGVASEAAPVYVLLLDPETRQPRYRAIARWNSNSELRYEIEGIEPGDYLIIAGSDIDVDQLICQPGEICGTYPSFHEQQPVTIDGKAVRDRDFSLDILTRFRSFETPVNAVTR